MQNLSVSQALKELNKISMAEEKKMLSELLRLYPAITGLLTYALKINPVAPPELEENQIEEARSVPFLVYPLSCSIEPEALESLEDLVSQYNKCLTQLVRVDMLDENIIEQREIKFQLEQSNKFIQNSADKAVAIIFYPHPYLLYH